MLGKMNTHVLVYHIMLLFIIVTMVVMAALFPLIRITIDGILLIIFLFIVY